MKEDPGQVHFDMVEGTGEAWSIGSQHRRKERVLAENVSEQKASWGFWKGPGNTPEGGIGQNHH